MVFSSVRAKREDPFKSPALAALKQQLAAAPKDDRLKEQIRVLDLASRERYFRHLFLLRSGAWLALGAAVIALCASKASGAFAQPLPLPRPNTAPSDAATRALIRSRWSVAVLASVAGIAFLSVAFGWRSPLPTDLAALEKMAGPSSGKPPAAVDYASDQEMRLGWPRFRGPGGNGVSYDTNALLVLTGSPSAKIAWKSVIPVRGFNSPIVWNNRVFLSGGDATQRQVLCYDAERGDLLWTGMVDLKTPVAADTPEIPEQTGYAASTLATDGRRVYALFANGDLAAFSLEGKQLWAKNLGFPKNPYGHASSLETWQGRVLVQIDQGEAEQNRSKLYALDGATGAVAWQRNRPVSASWATPIVAELAGKPQIVTLAVPWVIAYAARDGSELWRVEGVNGEVTPSPVSAAGLVFATSPNEKIMAIRPDGQGDVTKTHILWEAEDNVPDITSPVSDGQLLFLLTTPGLLTCYDIKDGKKVWEQDLAMECNASPTLAGQRLCIIATDGTILTVDAGRAFKELTRGQLGEKAFASPALVGGRVFVRGVQHLFCLGGEEKVARSN